MRACDLTCGEIFAGKNPVGNRSNRTPVAGIDAAGKGKCNHLQVDRTRKSVRIVRSDALTL